MDAKTSSEQQQRDKDSKIQSNHNIQEIESSNLQKLNSQPQMSFDQDGHHQQSSKHDVGELQRLDSPRFKHESPNESQQRQKDSNYQAADNNNNNNIDRLLDQSQQSHKTQQNNNNIGNQGHHQSHPSQDYAIKEFYAKRKERQQAQKDAEILANRIALLKQEEIRTLKKIEETRKKALEVYYLKKKNDDKQRRKKDNDEFKKKDSTQSRRKSQDRGGLEGDERTTLTKEQWAQVKKEKVQLIRDQTKANEDKIMKNKQTQIEKAKQRKQQIEDQKKNAKQKMTDFVQQRQQQIQLEIEYKAKQEEQQKQQKVGEIKRMEDYEIELISRLKSTQAMQQNAYEELENALMLSAFDFEKKYLITEEEEQQNLLAGGDSKGKSGGMKSTKSQPELRINSKN